MIIKNLTRKNPAGTGQLIRYIFRYILSEEKQLPSSRPFIVRHNLRSRSIEGYIKEFHSNEQNRVSKRKDQTAINHTIISMNGKDTAKLSDATLRTIAKKYIRLRGENNLYLFTKHSDRQHIHLHCAMSATQLDGRSNRITKAQFAAMKLELDSFQKQHFPELIHSLPLHGRSRDAKTAEKVLWRDGRASQKEMLKKTIETVFQNSKSTEDFLIQLKTLGHEPYFRAGRLTGIKCEGNRKFRFRSLGYDQEKVASLDIIHQREEKELAALRSIRGHSNERKRAKDIKERERCQETDGDHKLVPGNDGDDMERSDRLPVSFLFISKGFGAFPIRCVVQEDG